MAHFRGSASDRVEDLECGYQFARRVYLDLEPPGGHRVQHLGEAFRRRAQCREILWPCGDQFPLDGGPLGHRGPG